MVTKTKRSTRFDALQHAINIYRLESEKCKRSRAYLAGCILQGALLEASLTSMALVYRESVSKTRRYRRVKDRIDSQYHRSVRWLRDFSLADLEAIAIELRWVIGLQRELEVLRDTRNLIHPGKYADESGKRKPINRRYYQSHYAKLLRITDALYNKLEKSLREAMRREGMKV